MQQEPRSSEPADHKREGSDRGGEERCLHFLPCRNMQFHVSRGKKKKKNPGAPHCLERLDLTFALTRHLMLCGIVSCKQPSWSSVLVRSGPRSTLGSWTGREASSSVAIGTATLGGLRAGRGEGSREGSLWFANVDQHRACCRLLIAVCKP